MPIQRYVLYKLAQTAFLLWLILTSLFILFNSLPGSFGDAMLISGASPESIAAIQESWGLNDPIHVRYYRYLTNLLTGDAGTSLMYREPVIELTKWRIFNTFILAMPAITLGYVVGSLIGAILARKKGSTIERYGLLPLFVFGTIPSFFLAIVVVTIFGLWLGWFPTSGMQSISATTSGEAPIWKLYISHDFLHHYVLPFTVVFLRYAFLPAVIMRTSVIDSINQDYMYYHKVTGLSELSRLKHLLKHSILPVITMFPLSMTQAIGGLILVEAVFNWPGIGNQLVVAVLNRDIPVVQYIFFLVALVVVLFNAFIDILYGVIDPRVASEQN